MRVCSLGYCRLFRAAGAMRIVCREGRPKVSMTFLALPPQDESRDRETDDTNGEAQNNGQNPAWNDSGRGRISSLQIWLASDALLVEKEIGKTV